MMRTKAPDARTVPHVRGKPVTWLTSLPPNRGPTDADVRHNAILQMKEQRFTLKRGTNPVVDVPVIIMAVSDTAPTIGSEDRISFRMC